MDAKVTILKRPGEILGLCYAINCNEAAASLDKLTSKGYELVNEQPLPIVAQEADSKLPFFIVLEEANSDVVVKPSSRELNMKRLRPGLPQPLTFSCSSSSGQIVSMQLVVKEGDEVMVQEGFEIACKKREMPANPVAVPATSPPVAGNTGSSSAIASMISGSVQTLDMRDAKVDVSAVNNSHGDSHCDKRQTRIAQNMADSGGKIHITQHGGTNTQNVGKY